MAEQPTFAGIGSTAFIIRKEDLQPDTLTPKDGKQWAKIDLSGQVTIDVEPGEEFTPPVKVPIPSFRGFQTAEQIRANAQRTGFVMQGDVEDMLQGECERSEAFCKHLWDEMEHAPFDVFITGNDGQMQHIGKVDPDNIKVKVIDPIVPQFRKRRLRQKFRKKLMRYLERYEYREPFDKIGRDIYLNSTAAPTTRYLSKCLNKKIKMCKRGKTE